MCGGRQYARRVPTFRIDYLLSHHREDLPRCPACPTDGPMYPPAMEVWAIAAPYPGGKRALIGRVARCPECGLTVPLAAEPFEIDREQPAAGVTLDGL